VQTIGRVVEVLTNAVLVDELVVIGPEVAMIATATFGDGVAITVARPVELTVTSDGVKEVHVAVLVKSAVVPSL
jgi:hypothetical protein